MPEDRHTALLQSLRRLVRGLSALFWGLPVATVVVAVQAFNGDWLRLGMLPITGVTLLLLYGTHLLGGFQKQERVWMNAVERTRLLALVNLGLSPFLFFWSKVPGHVFFSITVEIMFLTLFLFLYLLNSVLARLAAMLPDETLRGETTLFTRLNQIILLMVMTSLPFHYLIHTLNKLPRFLVELLLILDRGGPMLELLLLMVFILLPVAMTMALLWKTKETIMNGVFSNVGGVEPPPGG